MLTLGFSIEALKLKLSAGEQKATEFKQQPLAQANRAVCGSSLACSVEIGNRAVARMESTFVQQKVDLTPNITPFCLRGRFPKISQKWLDQPPGDPLVRHNPGQW